MTISWVDLAAPTGGPVVATSDFKIWKRIDSTDTSQDTLIATLVAAATKAVENATGRALLSRQFRVYLDDFPRSSSEIRIPVVPVVSVDIIKYVDQTTGALTTWATTNYNTDIVREPGRIILAFGQVWPIPKFGTPGVVQIDFTAGYANPAAIPEPLVLAVQYLAGLWYDTREPILLMSGSPMPVPKTFDFLIGQYQMVYL